MNYSILQVSRGLGISVQQVERLAALGLLDSYRRIDQVRITRTALMQFCIKFGFPMSGVIGKGWRLPK